MHSGLLRGGGGGGGGGGGAKGVISLRGPHSFSKIIHSNNISTRVIVQSYNSLTKVCFSGFCMGKNIYNMIKVQCL